MICMNYNHNKKFRLLKFYSGYGKISFNSPTGYSKKIINAHTVVTSHGRRIPFEKVLKKNCPHMNNLCD